MAELSFGDAVGSIALPLLGQVYPVTLLSQACAFMTVIGAAGLFRKADR